MIKKIILITLIIVSLSNIANASNPELCTNAFAGARYISADGDMRITAQLHRDSDLEGSMEVIIDNIRQKAMLIKSKCSGNSVSFTWNEKNTNGYIRGWLQIDLTESGELITRIVNAYGEINDKPVSKMTFYLT